MESGAIAFPEKTPGRYYCLKHGRGIMSERYVETGSEQLARKLRLASESVDNPRLQGFKLAAKLNNAAISAHAVHYQRHTGSIRQLDMAPEHRLLILRAAPAQGIKPALAYGCHARVINSLLKKSEIVVGYMRGSAPRVYAHRVPRLPCLAVPCLARLDRRKKPRPGAAVGVNIVETLAQLPGSHGTGS